MTPNPVNPNPVNPNPVNQVPRLPPYYAITAPLEADGSTTPILEQRECRIWLTQFEQLLASDIELVQLRAKALSKTDLGTLAGHCQRLAASCENSAGERRRDERPEGPELDAKAVARASPRLSRAEARSYKNTEAFQSACRSDVYVATPSIRVLLNGPPELVTELGMAGVHLTGKALSELEERPLPQNYLVGASCHSPEGLAHAAAIGCDFACLSPVKVTKGYREADTLGFERFADWVNACDIPVYGLGGLGREDLEAVQEAGGQGVAGISAFWS